MKSNLVNTLCFAKARVVLILLSLALTVGIASLPAQAQDNTWKIDGEHSIARLSLGSGAKSVDVGVARVSGDVVLGASGPEISFKSKRSMVTNDGKVAVVGDLSVTRVERSVNLDPNEGYYGATYGEPVVHTDTREVTLLLPAEIRPAVENGSMQVSASTSVSREYFPQLLTALAPGNWPNLVVEDEQCILPANLGWSYSGGGCTGTPVTTATNAVAPATAGIGEGYYGFKPAVAPNGNRATISLNLELIQLSPASPATGVAGN